MVSTCQHERALARAVTAYCSCLYGREQFMPAVAPPIRAAEVVASEMPSRRCGR